MMTTTTAYEDTSASAEAGNVFAKTCSLIILAIASTIAGTLPIKLNDLFKSGDQNTPSTFDKVMSFFLNFGGGVLLCTVFLHLLPEIRNDVDQLEKRNILHQFVLSYPELIMCIGFFMMFFVEESMHSFISHSSTEKRDVSSVEMNGIENPVFTVKKVSLDAVAADKTIPPCAEHKYIKTEPLNNYHSCESDNCQHHDEHQHQHEHSHIPDLKKPSLNSFLTVLALSVHEIFEGLAVGLEKQTQMVWYLLTAIAVHKIVLAAFIGVQLVSTKIKKVVAYMYVIEFALTSPLGIFIGIMLTQEAASSDTLTLLSVILQAIATGTLLYIVFFEVFRKRFGDYKMPGIYRLIASLLGFVFMITIQLLLDKEED